MQGYPYKKMFEKTPKYILEIAGAFKAGYLEILSLIIINHIAIYLREKQA